MSASGNDAGPAPAAPRPARLRRRGGLRRPRRRRAGRRARRRRPRGRRRRRRVPASAARAERLLPGVQLLPPTRWCAAADLVAARRPGRHAARAGRRPRGTGAWRAGQLASSTPPARTALAVLGPAAEHGVLPLALHPAMTFTGAAEDADRLPARPFGVTAAESGSETGRRRARRWCWRWAASRAGSPRRTAPALPRRAGHRREPPGHPGRRGGGPAARGGRRRPARVLAPLLTAALDNGLRRGDRGLTGPVSRGDVGTVADHLETLTDRAPASVAAYVAMAQRTDGARAGRRPAQAARGRTAARPPRRGRP